VLFRSRHFQDNSAFDSLGPPNDDELQGYRILRSTELCSTADFRYISSASAEAASFTNFVDGEHYYYWFQSYNSSGTSSEFTSISSLGEQNFFIPNCPGRLAISNDAAISLNGAYNGLGYDIGIERRQRVEDIGGQVLQSVEFRAVGEGGMTITGFHFDKPGRLVLRYGTGASPGPTTSADAGKNLAVFWDNGVEFKKLYGKVDPVEQTVTVETPNVGVFQVRPLARSSGAVFDLSNLSSRVISPNGDGLNDLLIFTYDPGPANVAPMGKIYDVKGMFVADMVPGIAPNSLTWDGKMNGRAVTNGVYVYEIKGDGKTFSGTVVVAR
jgi:hypothetical protein